MPRALRVGPPRGDGNSSGARDVQRGPAVPHFQGAQPEPTRHHRLHHRLPVSTQSCRKNGYLQYKDSAGQMLLSGLISDCKLRSFGMPFGGKSCASCRPFRLFSQSAACQAGPAGGARWAATMLGHGQGPKGRSGGGGGVMVGGRSHHRGGLCYIILGEGVASSQANTLADAGSHTHGHVLPASPGHTPSRLRHPLRSPGFEHIHPHSAHEHGDARHLGLRCERAQLRPGVL